MNPAVTLSDDQLLGLLHAADPLPRTPSPETDAIWARIAAGLTAEPCLSTTPVRRRAAGLRRRPVLVAAACATAFAALGITLSLHGTSGVSLAERAYAQATLPGIAHWRAAIDVFHAGALASSEREEGWAANGVSHTILTNGASVTERRVAHGEETFRGPGGELGQGAASRTDLDRALPGADPFAAFQEAYESGRLQGAGNAAYTVILPASEQQSGVTLTYELDPQTGKPRLLTEETGDLRVVTRFEAYEHLADSPENKRLLSLGSR